MAKKRPAKKSFSSNYVQQFLSFVLPILLKNKENLIEKFSDIMNFRKIIKRYIILLILVLVAVIIIFDGLALFISSFYPGIRPGLVHILMGLVLIACVLVYKNLLLRR